MKVNKVEIHGASGWTVVSTTPRTYSLLALNAGHKSEILADAKIKVGTYDQARLSVDSITVKNKSGVTSEAKLPSNELRISTFLIVNGDSDSTINFDFLADKSLHITGNGKYIFAPVVKTESRSSAKVVVDGNGKVTTTGGRVDYTSSVGMDIDGSIKLNFQVNGKEKLNLDADNVIKVEGIMN